MKAEYENKYSQLNPLERNQHLLDLFLMLPSSLYEDFPNNDDWISKPGMGRGIEELDRRSKSQMRLILLEKLDALLRFSCTTDPCQAYIKYNYEGYYIDGVGKIDITTNLFKGILFRNHAISSGIFLPETGKDMERSLYKDHVFGKLDILHHVEQLFKEKNIEMPPLKEFEYWANFIAANQATNPNQRFEDPAGYEKIFAEAKTKEQNFRETLQSWSNAFFTMHQEEI